LKAIKSLDDEGVDGCWVDRMVTSHARRKWAVNHAFWKEFKGDPVEVANVLPVGVEYTLSLPVRAYDGLSAGNYTSQVELTIRSAQCATGNQCSRCYSRAACTWVSLLYLFPPRSPSLGIFTFLLSPYVNFALALLCTGSIIHSDLTSTIDMHICMIITRGLP
jgi:hypothetical protein